MKKLWNETRRIEDFLSGAMKPAMRSFFLKKMKKEVNLASKIHWQEQTYRLIRLSARRQLKREIREIEAQLFGSNGHKDLTDQINQIWRTP